MLTVGGSSVEADWDDCLTKKELSSSALPESSATTLLLLFCEYKILRFLDSDDFAGINFCDFTKSS